MKASIASLVLTFVRSPGTRTCVKQVGGIVLAACFAAPAARAQYKSINPQVSRIVSEVSAERITATLEKLEGFGTRDLRSSQDEPNRGIGAARRWIYEQFQSYSPRLQVSYDQYRVRKDPSRGSRIPQDVDVYNVVAVLKIEAVLNSDIIGSELGGDGRTANRTVNVFSEDPMDSPSREIARYVKEIGERYVPSMTVDPIFRADRFGRDGDQRSFYLEGFGAVRFSSPVENFANEHSATDTFAGTSPGLITRVTQVNGAVAASLAWAPKSPKASEVLDFNGLKLTIGLLTRGKSGYDALLKWKDPNPEPDLAGYVVLRRRTTAPFWEQDIYVGNVKEFAMPNVAMSRITLVLKRAVTLTYI